MCINASNQIIKEKWVFAFHEDKYMGINLKNINLKCTWKHFNLLLLSIIYGINWLRTYTYYYILTWD